MRNSKQLVYAAAVKLGHAIYYGRPAELAEASLPQY
jgi:hypothetical protein